MAAANSGAAGAAVLAYVALGANLGDAAANLRQAARALDELRATRVSRLSGIYRSAPLDSAGPDYLNAVVELQTALDAPTLLDQLLQIEQRAGRDRPYRHAPRTLDLDLLLYGAGRIDSLKLVLPHPRMRERAFVLLPLAEIAPEQVSAGDLQAVANQSIVRIGELISD